MANLQEALDKTGEMVEEFNEGRLERRNTYILIGATGQIAVAKKAIAVVNVVKNMA